MNAHNAIKPSSHTPCRPRRTPAAGFTIVELLVTIAIIFVLLTTVLVAMRTVRRSGERTTSLNALRQMTTAYVGYATEHGGRLMPGYIDPTDLPGQNPLAAGEIDIRAKLRTGYLLNEGDTSSYVWRLAPYLDHDWSAFMIDYRDKELVARLEVEYSNGDGVGGDVFGPGTAGAIPAQLGIARVPAYGLNSIYLGGDNFHGDEALSPWDFVGGGVQNNPNTIAAVRMSNVKTPAKIIVFGACEQLIGAPHTRPDPNYAYGYFELRAPFANYNATTQTGSDPQWIIDMANGPTAGQPILQGGAGPAGVPISRLGDERTPISHLDGSTEMESISRLSVDMSRWAPNAVSGQ